MSIQLNTTLSQRLHQIRARVSDTIGQLNIQNRTNGGAPTWMCQLEHQLDRKIEWAYEETLSPHQLHKYHCESKWCKHCLSTEEEFNSHEVEQHKLYASPALLAECIKLLEEHVAILSGKQFERNPTAMIMNRSSQLLTRITATLENSNA